MVESITAPAPVGAGDYEAMSEQMELESLRYCRALPEEEEARER